MYSLLYVIWIIRSRRTRWLGLSGMYRREDVACRVLVGKFEGKWSLQRIRHRWEDNIKMDIQEIAWVDGDWIHLAEYRDKSMCHKVVGSINAWNFLISWETAGFMRSTLLHGAPIMHLLTMQFYPVSYYFHLLNPMYFIFCWMCIPV